ncbi:MAG TPA: polysaccharide biosynthesis/export family protein, partial [Gammaproteobacteria bacterium]|nr:polysaccharide biosynthesis/export family protein [Gammaproteobacteria bacterium]
MTHFRYKKICLLVSIALFLVGCSHNYPLLEKGAYTYNLHSSYHIGPGDHLSILVWKNADLTLGVIVRPDGFITLPLVDDIQAAGKTPMVLAEDLEHALAEYLKDPLVTVMVTGFIGTYTDTIRIVGEATQPQSLPYRDGMTVLDLMIVVG